MRRGQSHLIVKDVDGGRVRKEIDDLMIVDPTLRLRQSYAVRLDGTR